jgi:Flp pilus assembly protein TadD
MTTFSIAIAIRRITLGAAFVLALTFSGRAHAATTFEGAMNQGMAAFRARNFANAAAWFNTAQRMKPGNRSVMFWSANASGYQAAQSHQWAAAANHWRRSATLYPGSAGQLSVNINYAVRVTRGQESGDFDEFIGDLEKVSRIFLLFAPLF